MMNTEEEAFETSISTVKTVLESLITTSKSFDKYQEALHTISNLYLNQNTNPAEVKSLCYAIFQLKYYYRKDSSTNMYIRAERKAKHCFELIEMLSNSYKTMTQNQYCASKCDENYPNPIINTLKLTDFGGHKDEEINTIRAELIKVNVLLDLKNKKIVELKNRLGTQVAQNQVYKEQLVALTQQLGAPTKKVEEIIKPELLQSANNKNDEGLISETQLSEFQPIASTSEGVQHEVNDDELSDSKINWIKDPVPKPRTNGAPTYLPKINQANKKGTKLQKISLFGEREYKSSKEDLACMFRQMFQSPKSGKM